MSDESSPAMPDAAETCDARADAKRKKKKVRSVWIAFVGRIVAQFVGSAATIVLGILVLHKYQPAKSEAADIKSPPAVTQPASTSSLTSLTSDTLSVVVLPLHNRAANGAQQFIADAMTDVLTAEVAKIPGVHVISRTSASNVRGDQLTLTEISSKLHARYVIEGSVVQDRDRVRVSVQLIDAAHDEFIWSGRYDHGARDILSGEEDMAAAIAQEIRSVLDRPDRGGPRAVAARLD